MVGLRVGRAGRRRTDFAVVTLSGARRRRDRAQRRHRRRSRRHRRVEHASSSTRGDSSTGRFALADLSGGTALRRGARLAGQQSRHRQRLPPGQRHGAAHRQRWDRRPCCSRSAARTGAPTRGHAFRCRRPITLPSGPGSSRAGIASSCTTGPRLSPSICRPVRLTAARRHGTVQPHRVRELGLPGASPSRSAARPWIAYVEDFNTIARRRVPDGLRRVIGRFSSLSDMCSFTSLAAAQPLGTSIDAGDVAVPLRRRDPRLCRRDVDQRGDRRRRRRPARPVRQLPGGRQSHSDRQRQRRSRRCVRRLRRLRRAGRRRRPGLRRGRQLRRRVEPDSGRQRRRRFRRRLRSLFRFRFQRHRRRRRLRRAGQLPDGAQREPGRRGLRRIRRRV